ncbi:hypothetical protein ABL78_8549 [Leptomonas seymouri]|uniref:Uncharacterized protein n=1 Tax=Leptomonas seymouri TaxID=5684 RepID=A0A0N1P8W4_LEPSE|nr:hypothetical protein ABL78_8549 [Leptomonas seymouri]|eukprot:KPI82441.1 hypothetical protein ABL78_8549 [Leptomonas seymouri]
MRRLTPGSPRNGSGPHSLRRSVGEGASPPAFPSAIESQYACSGIFVPAASMVTICLFPPRSPVGYLWEKIFALCSGWWMSPMKWISSASDCAMISDVADGFWMASCSIGITDATFIVCTGDTLSLKSASG